jgi:hypothetical protein
MPLKHCHTQVVQTELIAEKSEIRPGNILVFKPSFIMVRLISNTISYLTKPNIKMFYFCIRSFVRSFSFDGTVAAKLKKSIWMDF